MFTRKQKIELFFVMMFFTLVYPIYWLMENENTKKGKVIIFIVQVVVSAIASYICAKYLF